MKKTTELKTQNNNQETPKKKKNGGHVKAAIHSQKVGRKKNFSSAADHSRPLNVRVFPTNNKEQMVASLYK